jgi:predicted transcriptional regulator
MTDKKISEITVRLSEELKIDAMEVASFEDRTLSEIIRIALQTYLYGHKHRVDEACGHAEPCTTSRGKRA